MRPGVILLLENKLTGKWKLEVVKEFGLVDSGKLEKAD
jgi:hypothetical protein